MKSKHITKTEMASRKHNTQAQQGGRRERADYSFGSERWKTFPFRRKKCGRKLEPGMAFVCFTTWNTRHNLHWSGVAWILLHL